MQTIKDFKQTFDLVGYFQDRREAEARGRRTFVLCPFHNDQNPSMLVDRDRAYCFGCGKSFDAIDILQKIEGKTIYEILNQKIDYNFPRPIYQKPIIEKPYICKKKLSQSCLILDKSKRAKGYLLNRRITEATIKDRQLGYGKSLLRGIKYPKFIIPVYDIDKNLISVVYRQDPWFNNDNGLYLDQQKYIVHPKTKVALYGIDQFYDTDYFVYVGGQIDALSLMSQGIPALGVSGECTFKQEWIEQLRQKRLLIMLDNDQAGREGTRKIKAFLPHAKEIKWPIGTNKMDVNDLVRKNMTYIIRREIDALAGHC